jgi:hypothetical protein
MIDSFWHSTVEINGESFQAEVTFCWNPEDRPSIDEVFALKQVAKKGEVWYDENGRPHDGPHWLRLDVTPFVDLKSYVDEIIEHFQWGQAQRRKLAA